MTVVTRIPGTISSHSCLTSRVGINGVWLEHYTCARVPGNIAASPSASVCVWLGEIWLNHWQSQPHYSSYNVYVFEWIIDNLSHTAPVTMCMYLIESLIISATLLQLQCVCIWLNHWQSQPHCSSYNVYVFDWIIDNLSHTTPVTMCIFISVHVLQYK